MNIYNTFTNYQPIFSQKWNKHIFLLNIFIRPTIYFCSLVNNEFYVLKRPFYTICGDILASVPLPPDQAFATSQYNPTITHSLLFSQRVSVRPLHRDYKRDADEHGLPAHTRSRDGAAAASGAGQAVLRCCGTAACGGRYRWVLFAPPLLID